MGDLYGGGATTLISMYYLYFLTDVLRINPGLAGTAFLFSKIWDAVTDPFMGIISDNTRTRFGRRRPYFLAGIFLIFVSFVLMWAPVNIQRESLKFLYVLMTYLFFSTVFTLVWVPYNSISAELSADYDERTRLAKWRMIFSNIAGILAGTLGKDIFVDALNRDNPARGFFIMSIAFGLFFALPYIFTFLWCKEDPAFMETPRKKIGSLKDFIGNHFVEPLRLRPFRFVVYMFLFGFMAQDAVLALAVYFMSYYLEIPSMMTLLVPVYLSMLLAIPVAEMISGKIGKRKTYLFAGFLWLAAFALVPFMSSSMPVWLIYLFGLMFGTAAAGIQVMVFAMFPDIPDADDLFSGQRREGLFSGIFSLLRKTGSALVMFFIGNSIGWAGYRAPVTEIVNGLERTVARTQTPEFLMALLLIFMVIPNLFILIAMMSCWKYPITRDVHSRIQNYLQIRKENSPDLVSEAEDLKKILEGTKK
jgi:oligogalacturonide transporter